MSAAKEITHDSSQAILWAHVALIVAVSVFYESLFLHHGVAWLFDEGWPLYAAKRLHEGGVLYQDVFFSFPPGHLLPAWIAYALDPPGIVLARTLYSAFTVLLCLALYFLGRRMMLPSFALLASLMVALAAPRSHLAHLLFGYRYLVFSVVALIAYGAYLRSGERRLMILAGLATGVALYFRLTPAFATACGVGIAVMAANRDYRCWLRDWTLFLIGLLIVAMPTAAWFAGSVGLDTLWREVVVRIIGLQSAQSKPIPGFVWQLPMSRELIYRNFVPVQYWTFGAMYCGYAVVLAAKWARATAQRRPLPNANANALLLAVVIWGAIYLLRTLGRSDEHHLTSAIPPACLLVAHLTSLLWGVALPRPGFFRPSRVAQALLCASVLGAWVFLQGSDLYLDASLRGLHPIRSLGDPVSVRRREQAARVDWQIRTIRRMTLPGDTMLDLRNAPLLHVVTGRNGPGVLDVVTPGVFRNEAEERALITRMEESPPALVLWPLHDFDGLPSRSISTIAPLVAQWVQANYQPLASHPRSNILVPR